MKSVIGNFADVLGVLLLVTGFVQTIRARRAQEKIICELESLLPICNGWKEYKAEDDRARGLQTGSDDYLTKPFASLNSWPVFRP